MEKRNIPEMGNSLLFFMDSGERTEESYNELMEKIELESEEKLKKLLRKIGISSSVKKDRYSLPYQNEITYIGYGSSFLNEAWDTTYFFREICKELLNSELYKIRFYIMIEVVDSFPMGNVNFKFRYFKH